MQPTLTLTSSALGHQRMSSRALALIAPFRVGTGASPAQQWVPGTLIHVWACGERERGGVRTLTWQGVMWLVEASPCAPLPQPCHPG